jgi:hypothetical protein
VTGFNRALHDKTAQVLNKQSLKPFVRLKGRGAKHPSQPSQPNVLKPKSKAKHQKASYMSHRIMEPWDLNEPVSKRATPPLNLWPSEPFPF